MQPLSSSQSSLCREEVRGRTMARPIEKGRDMTDQNTTPETPYDAPHAGVETPGMNETSNDTLEETTP